MEFSHIDKDGSMKMVDISDKASVRRIAVAQGCIKLQPETLKQLQEKLLKKGDALSAAKLAGICGAKKTSELIPLCHNIEIENVDLEFAIEADGIRIQAEARCTGKTGIEMEALTAVAVAALTIYDMCKAIDTSMKITDINLIKKTKERV